jgi:hypothetical protein
MHRWLLNSKSAIHDEAHLMIEIQYVHPGIITAVPGKNYHCSWMNIFIGCTNTYALMFVL